MNLQIKGIHYEVSDRTVEQIEKKVKKLEFAKDMITDLLFKIEREKTGYVINSDVNFRWGLSHHIKVSNHDLYDAIDSIIDKLKHKISKEKEKIQEH